jgi:cold shock CspA family protein
MCDRTHLRRDDFLTGTIKMIDPVKWFGFISTGGGGPDFYFRLDALRGDRNQFRSGARVRFRGLPQQQGSGRGPVAVAIELVEAAPAGADHPQAEFIARMRAESCIDPRVPLGQPPVAWPTSGPTVGTYYDRLRRGGKRDAA